MVARATSAVLSGVEAIVVRVEVDLGPGLPAFSIVGLPDTTVQEARDRVRAAIAHSGQTYPMTRITANLAPSGVPKHGPGLDLVLALALLVADGKAPQMGLDGRLVIGELGLAGDVRGVRGALSAAEAARRQGVTEVVCPCANAAEAALAGLPVLPVRTLREAIEAVKGRPPPPVTADPATLLSQPGRHARDLGEIRGQERAKRALEIAAAGGHNVLFAGPPGTGKTLLARALPGILPRLMIDEALEVTRIHSAAGLLPAGEALVCARPFRAPHHGVSLAGMVGGGSAFTRPGEVTIAHRGVLFLDELPEFPRSVLESLRQPLEDGCITITRARESVTYPSRFQLVAAMNPCPCGHRGSDVQCRCSAAAFEIYRRRLSGPLLDRIDLHVHVPRVESEDLLRHAGGESSGDVRARVEPARGAGSARAVVHGATCNAELPPNALLRACALDDGAGVVLSKAARRHRLSARSVHRVLRLARTIADLAGAGRVDRTHVLEAVTYRVGDGS